MAMECFTFDGLVFCEKTGRLTVSNFKETPVVE